MVNTNFMYYAIKFDLNVLHQLQKYKARLGQYQDHVEWSLSTFQQPNWTRHWKMLLLSDSCE